MIENRYRRRRLVRSVGVALFHYSIIIQSIPYSKGDNAGNYVITTTTDLSSVQLPNGRILWYD